MPVDRTDSKEVILQPLHLIQTLSVPVAPSTTDMESFGVPRHDWWTTSTSLITSSCCPLHPACAYGGPQNVANHTAPPTGPTNGRPQPSSSAQSSPHSCLTLCNPMDCSMSGLPVHHPPTPRVYPHSCLLSQWYHPTISSSVIPFFFHLQSFPASGSFQMSQLFTSGGPSIGVSASKLVLPMNTQDWSPLG